jgi:RimJ/RimL family protein N-acetyltransferase
MLPEGVPLAGRWVALKPVVEADLPALAAILVEPAVYASGYVMHHRPGSIDEALAMARERYLDPPACDGEGRGRVVYAVSLAADSALGGAAGTLVGTTSLGEVYLGHQRAHLGWTMYHPVVWGTAVNPETKYLLLRHCFEDLGYGRVKIQTDALNTRSAAAIAKLGAVREGVLRRHLRREDGSFRDTVVFAVTAQDWPRVRDGLQARLSAIGDTSAHDLSAGSHRS